MKQIKRIAIIGNAGSGKSTLARRLQKVLNLPVYHLDKYYWKPNWVKRDDAEYKLLHDALCAQDTWIIDGVNFRVLDYRVERADIVIFLDVPTYVCLWRILKRTFKYYGKIDPTGPEGCFQRLNWEYLKFLKWVWNFNSRYTFRLSSLTPVSTAERMHGVLQRYVGIKEIHVLKTQKQLDQFVESLFQK